MKIRTGFVTNSSSSSFVTVVIKAKNGLGTSCEIYDYGVNMQEQALFAAKTMPELIQALCSSLDIDSPEKGPGGFKALVDGLLEIPLDEIDAIEFNRTENDFGEFVTSHVEGKTFTEDYEENEDGDEIEVKVELDPDDVKSVNTRYVDVLHRKFKITMHSMEKDINLYDGNIYCDEYSTKSITIPEDVTVLDPDAFSFSNECIYLDKIIFLGRLETIGTGAFKAIEHRSVAIIAPKTPLAKFCGKAKEKAILGFASCWKKKPDPKGGVYKYEPEIQAGYLKYIQSHREKLASLAEENPFSENWEVLGELLQEI